jgi:polysaccharide export outer membrane protein
LCAAVVDVTAAMAQHEEYVLGTDDVLGISVWMHAELDRVVTVDAQGDITLPPIGEVKAAGLTAKQLADRIGDRLSSYLRQTTTVTVSVTQFMSHSVSVSGAVARPGRYGFEHIPGLLDVLSQAGGALSTAELSRVQILRKEGARLRSLPADLTTALQMGTEEGLPKLLPGDVIVVPAGATGGAVATDAVGVLGEVNRPGLYSVGTGQDLWVVLSQAGGPTGRSNLSAIKVLTREQPDAQRAVTVNLQETLERGNRSPFMVKPGDIVYLTPRGGGAWGGFLTMLSVTRDVVGIVTLVRVLENR